MKSRLQAVSALVLIALVLSFVPAAAMPASASAAQTCTDRAQFVADVTVPDGTRYDPGATFKKTWQLRNVGTCTWTTSYTMFFESGTPMGSTTSVNLPSSTAPGATVDVSVDMTAPSTAGFYRGYWKFKNASGVAFGIGRNANSPWWVEINVTSSSQAGVVYNFADEANAKKASWLSGAGGLSFPGTNDDPKGFSLRLENPAFEDRVAFAQPSLLFSPQQITNGYIQATYPEFPVQNGDRFRARVGCELNATSCYVQYRLDYQIGNNTPRTFWTFRERHEGWTYDANLNLSPLAGQNVKFILYMSAWGSAIGDRAIWGNPVIVRPGATPTTPSPVTGTPPTSTPTTAPGTVTATVPPSACDRAQFVSDVTVPDRTIMAPGQTFSKTWSLKNVGTCAWTKSYQLVFFSGERMGAATSYAFTEDVPVGKTANFTIPNMTAPSAAGSYRGFWMFKNANGALFGIGRQANQPWWVDIRVSGPTVTPGGPTVTPGGPTVTPGGPTVTPGAGIAYDFATNACAATWYTLAGQLNQCPGTDGDAKGFVLKVSNPKLETGVTDPRPGLLTFPSPPQGRQDGYIQGFFPPFRVQNGDRFRSIINCEGGATLCYVAFRLDYQTGNEPIRTLFGPFLEKRDTPNPLFFSVDVNLSALAGKDVKFILTVLSAGVNTGDRALWVGPHIYRATSGGATVVPTTPTTPVATTPTPTSTVPTTPTTPTPTSTVPTTPTTPVATTPTPTSTVPPTPTTPVPASYQNSQYNFRFNLPSGATIAYLSDNAGRVNLPLVTPGTNLVEKYIQVSVEEGKNPCLSTDRGGGGTPENVTINNIPFTKQNGQDAAAGNRYHWIAYSTTNNNACISLAFILHSLNRDNYATPPPAFDVAKESEVIGTTMSTYNKIN
jgi:hypothetical protein